MQWLKMSAIAGALVGAIGLTTMSFAQERFDYQVRDAMFRAFGGNEAAFQYAMSIIDEKLGEIVGFWKQIVNKTDGTRDEIYGIGGSWFRLNDDLKIEWQRDFFDFGHVSKMFGQLIQSGDLSTGMQKRIERAVAGEKVPGYYPLGEAPVAIW